MSTNDGPPNECSSCLNPEALNFQPLGYVDCVGGIGYPVDYTCCQYVAPTITPTGHCEYPNDDGDVISCIDNGTCSELGSCYYGVIWEGIIKAEYPITLNWAFNIQNNISGEYEDFTVYRDYPENYTCSISGGDYDEDNACTPGPGPGCEGDDDYCTRSFIPIGTAESTNGTYVFTDNLTDPPTMDLNTIPSNIVSYYVKSDDNHSLSDASTIINIEFTFAIGPNYTLFRKDMD